MILRFFSISASFLGPRLRPILRDKCTIVGLRCIVFRATFFEGAFVPSGHCEISSEIKVEEQCGATAVFCVAFAAVPELSPDLTRFW